MDMNKKLEKLNGKVYKIGNVTIVNVNPREIEIWSEGNFIILKEDQIADFSSCFQMMNMDVYRAALQGE